MTNKSSSASLLSSAGYLTALVPVGLAIGNAAAEIILALVVILFSVHTIKNRDFAWLKQDWVIALLALWAYGCFRSFFTDNPGKTFIDSFPWIRFILFAVALESWILIHEKWRNLLLNFGIIAIAWLAGDAIFQYLHGTDVFGRAIASPHRLTASYSKPIVGIMIAWTFMPFLFGRLVKKQNWVALGFAALTLTAVLLSGERMAFIFSMLSIVLVTLFIPYFRKTGLIAIFIFVIAMVGLMAMKPNLYDRQVKSTISVIRNLPDSPYGVIWHSAFDIVRDHPVFGIGMGNFRLICPDSRYGPDDPVGHGYSRCASHPHNIYLEWLTEGGIIALFGFITAMFLVMRRLFRNVGVNRHNYLFLALTITYTVRLWPVASSTSFFHGWSAIPFWLVMGWALAYCRFPDRTP
ncbi:MAG: O-antigen ligase family protein [Burkholderiales bacterium]